MISKLVRILLLSAAIWCAFRPAVLPAGSEKYPAAYSIALEKAFSSFHARDFHAAAKYLDIADRSVPGTPAVLNARGAIAIENHRFDEGEKYCRAALEKDPQFYLALFNLGEIPFMQGRYTEARDAYQEVLAAQPSNELVQYRIFLTYLLEKNDASAQETLNRMKYPSDSGAYYYAHAAWELAHGHEPEGLKWIKTGDWIFSHEKNLYLADPLCDLGWLKRERNDRSSAE